MNDPRPAPQADPSTVPPPFSRVSRRRGGDEQLAARRLRSGARRCADGRARRSPAETKPAAPAAQAPAAPKTEAKPAEAKPAEAKPAAKEGEPVRGGNLLFVHQQIPTSLDANVWTATAGAGSCA